MRIAAKLPDEIRFRQKDTPATRSQKLEILREWLLRTFETIEFPEIDLSALAPLLLTIDTVPDAVYVFKTADIWHHKRFTRATPVVAIVPTDASDPIPIGARIRVTQAGAGQVTLTPEDGTVVLNSRDGALKSTDQFAVSEIEKVGENEWDVLGDVTT